MVADVRSVVGTPFDGTSGTVRRGEAKVGDFLLAIHSEDSAGAGALNQMSISGGGTWRPVDAIDVTGTARSRIWRKDVTTSEPEEYDLQQKDDFAAGAVTILAIRGGDPTGIIVVKSAGTIAPAAAPASASGLEIRYGAGTADDSVSWAQLDGYSGLDVSGGLFTTASLAVRPFLSSTPLGAVDLAPSPEVEGGHAFTILIKSSSSGSGGGPPPTPPTFPASTPAKGITWMRYTIHDFLTGAYRGDIYPFGVVLDRRIGEPGTWRGRLALANRREAAKINEIFPRDPADLLSGPGRLVVHTWRGGTLWGLHWLHTTVTEKGERGNVWMDVQGSTLDGYLLHVALEEELAFGDDMLANARSLVQHMQATPGSNAGLALQAGVSGTVRPLTATPGPNVTYGQVLQNYARQAGGFEHVVNPRVIDGALIRSLEWGAPIISNPDAEHVFTEGTEGGDITTWREERSALRGGTRWGVIGGTPPQEDATQGSAPVRSALVETPHIAAGWPIIDRRVTHPTESTDQTTLDAYAAHWASRAPGAPPVFSADVVIGKTTTLDPNGLGDYIKYKLNNPRYPIINGASSFNLRQRLVGWSLTPSERGNGKDRVQLITEQVEVPG